MGYHGGPARSSVSFPQLCNHIRILLQKQNMKNKGELNRVRGLAKLFCEKERGGRASTSESSCSGKVNKQFVRGTRIRPFQEGNW
jgi:hypothetical protein